MELQHHGIKGQKWGIRRFQRKDGSLTPAGERRYSDSSDSKEKEVKVNRRTRLQQDYVRAGMTEEQAKKAVDKRIRAERIVLAASAITLTACAAYYANKAIKRRVDQVIKSGETLQRIEMKDTNGKLFDVFYAAKGTHDKERYKNLLGATRQRQTGEAYILKLMAKKDVKVASQDKAMKVFKKLYETDEEFRKEASKYSKKHFTGANVVSGRNFRKMYENFNSNLIDIRESGGKSGERFFEELRKSGYGAIQDINDMKFSGYRAKNPLIFFDNSSGNIMVKSVSKISENLAAAGQEELRKAALEEIWSTNVESLAKSSGVYGGVIGGIGLLSRAAPAEVDAVTKYKNEHPNTELTDLEIFKMVTK